MPRTMIRQRSYNETCTSTITETTTTVQSEPSLTTLLLREPPSKQTNNAMTMVKKQPKQKRPRRPTAKQARLTPTPIQTQKRSSRLFFLLLHLVGVSTNLNQSSWPGITAVHPAKTIYLQRLDLSSSASLLQLVQTYGEDVLHDPFWFQNEEGKCLGVAGLFGECGDTTLWRVRRKEGRRRKRQVVKNSSSSNRKKRQRKGVDSGENTVCAWPFFCDEAVSEKTKSDEFGEMREEEGFALELVDVDDYEFGGAFFLKKPRWRRRRFLWLDNDDYSKGDCLVSFPSGDTSSSLQLGSCSSQEAWMWHVNRNGVLVRELTKSEKRKLSKRRWIGSPITAGSHRSLSSSYDADVDMLCLHTSNSTGTLLHPCQGDRKLSTVENKGELVGFSLVRYPSASYRLGLQSSNVDESSPWITLEGSSSKQAYKKQEASNKTSEPSTSDSEHHMPSSRTGSQNHASNTKLRHAEVKSTASMLHTGLNPGKHQILARTSASHIRDAQGATVDGRPFYAGAQHGENSHDEVNIGKIKTASLLHKEKPQKRHSSSFSEANEKSSGNSESSTYHRPIKIPVHPYIEASKDGIWVDPLTSLEYPTDLCEYLGHTKKEAGRHTLMGVGQYFRTAFNIKVYGAALYVAKRDVLADPKFSRYATLSSEELQNRDDFYEHLMNMPSPGDDPTNSLGGFFDRTLMVKTNMQLSTDAMRKSLEADWSLLTDEMKTLIIESSFRERTADARMLEKIKSKENSSNCSCGQKAPEEFAAEPSCCARGTELVFTWRKNGDFEVRLDGRVMDIFPRPDMARGIFSEYMNKNPISLDAKSHFADGFPFLLAPLAQVKGMSSAVPVSHDFPKKAESNSSGNPVFHLMMHPVHAMNSQAHTLSKWMHEGAAEISSTLDDALGSAVGIARGFGAEFERRRMELLDNALALHDEINSLITSSLEREGGTIAGSTSLSVDNRYNSPTGSPSRGSSFDTNAMFSNMPDEIGIEMEPTMNFTHWLFFTTVHVYLVLLFVVSLQDSYTTKFIVKRK